MAQALESDIIFSLINKPNFEINSRPQDELYEYIANPRTTNLAKICLPGGNLNFVQFHRSSASLYMNKASAKSLELETKLKILI